MKKLLIAALLTAVSAPAFADIPNALLNRDISGYTNAQKPWWAWLREDGTAEYMMETPSHTKATVITGFWAFKDGNLLISWDGANIAPTGMVSENTIIQGEDGSMIWAFRDEKSARHRLKLGERTMNHRDQEDRLEMLLATERKSQ